MLIEPELTPLEERVEERKLLEHRFGTQDPVPDQCEDMINHKLQEAAVGDDQCRRLIESS